LDDIFFYLTIRPSRPYSSLFYFLVPQEFSIVFRRRRARIVRRSHLAPRSSADKKPCYTRLTMKYEDDNSFFCHAIKYFVAHRKKNFFTPSCLRAYVLFTRTHAIHRAVCAIRATGISPFPGWFAPWKLPYTRKQAVGSFFGNFSLAPPLISAPPSA
jgi:hypothetical protein